MCKYILVLPEGLEITAEGLFFTECKHHQLNPTNALLPPNCLCDDKKGRSKTQKTQSLFFCLLFSEQYLTTESFHGLQF